jgi:polyphosphate glucokinase
MVKKTAKEKARQVLAIDVGGTNVKVLLSGQKEPLKIPSGSSMSAAKMVRDVKRAAKNWKYDAVSIGYPGPVIRGRPMKDPYNLAPGWVGFDFRRAFGRPIQLVNDAAMQAIGSYKGGRMLFLGLGTGLGTAMIIDGVVGPMELAHLPYKKGKTYEDFLGLRGLQSAGKKKWRRRVAKVTEELRQALGADYVVIGGGNAKKLKQLPPKTYLGDNRNAFQGGFRLWNTGAGKVFVF